MASDRPAEETATGRAPSRSNRGEEAGRGDRWELVVCVDGRFETHRLPARMLVTIGRGSGNNVPIDHSSVSRSHALLMVGDEISVLDRGSANGTRVAGHPLVPSVPCVAAPGDAIELGMVVAIVQRVSAARPPRTFLTHDYFEARLEEECARGQRHGGAFSVLRLSMGGDGESTRAEAALHEMLRSHDVIGLYAPGEYEVLLATEPERAMEIAGRLLEQLRERGLSPRAGLAHYPVHGATPSELVARANGAVRGIEDDGCGGDVALEVPSSPMTGVRELVAQAARSMISVLVLGETGVGKEIVAETLHRLSHRADRTFLRLNCAALTESLLESELFGHERGAFTGATAAKPGLLESAEGGTVFLDEVGELPLTTQVKLLRVIEERKLMRVGGLTPRAIDVRFVAATNRDLEAEVARGAFRQDLFFRLNGITIVVPPLRERREEIPRLARAFAANAVSGGAPPPELTPAALQALAQYDWPGNIRELRNVVERAVLLSKGQPITPRHLPVDKMKATRLMTAPPGGGSAPPASAARDRAMPLASGSADAATDSYPIVPDHAAPSSPLREDIESLERQRILDALERCAWNQTKAAQLLGISRGTLVSRLDRYNVARPRKRG